MFVRPAIAVLFMYICGSPAFDGIRPAFSDRPLVGLYNEVTLQVRDTALYVSTLSPANQPVDIMNAVLKHGS